MAVVGERLEVSMIELSKGLQGISRKNNLFAKLLIYSNRPPAPRYSRCRHHNIPPHISSLSIPQHSQYAHSQARSSVNQIELTRPPGFGETSYGQPNLAKNEKNQKTLSGKTVTDV